MNSSYNTLSEAIKDFQSKGYTEDFNLLENHIESRSLKKKWAPDELIVIKFYRFEGESNPADNSILYVIETTDGTKGLLVDSYGAQRGAVSSEMIQKLKMNPH
ncbi:phosphoribosylpyrophosphate synthetase [uncultured Planktosalinus sp.]|uniref:phosphoribosylpyrophosphate synthetase n=1 Tax=uncultured Planktosalinus sp. TaxID=1810935 RepID=UPI0030D99E72